MTTALIIIGFAACFGSIALFVFASAMAATGREKPFKGFDTKKEKP